MTGEQAVVAVIDALEAAGVPYMVVGSLSSNLYGIPRSTHDADIVVQLAPERLSELRKLLAPPFRWEPQMSFETVTGTTRQILEAPGGVFKIELFFLTDDPHDQARFARRVPVAVLGRQAYAASAEDVVITKLRWSKQGQRHKDVDDVRAVLTVSGAMLDWDYIHRWCDAHGTRALLDEIRRTIPQI
ncbi:MAG TPA: hypothetical protein PLP66_07140 [Phycisphaerae bacterium]|nr:hypothetical protein [Phycisphaerae bacterium]HQL55345.1 hypothetical protein [Phycisphaerae bacterium]